MLLIGAGGILYCMTKSIVIVQFWKKSDYYSFIPSHLKPRASLRAGVSKLGPGGRRVGVLQSLAPTNTPELANQGLTRPEGSQFQSSHKESVFVNTPDSDNQLVRSAFREWAVYWLTCSLHSVHCSLLSEQGKSVEVYFTSEHSFMDLRSATSSRTDKCDIIYLCEYLGLELRTAVDITNVQARVLKQVGAKLCGKLTPQDHVWTPLT